MTTPLSTTANHPFFEPPPAGRGEHRMVASTPPVIDLVTVEFAAGEVWYLAVYAGNRKAARPDRAVSRSRPSTGTGSRTAVRSSP